MIGTVGGGARIPVHNRKNPLTNSDDSRQSMLSVPSNWSDLYFDIFAILCAIGELFVVCYVILRPPPSADALDMAADIILRLAAVPIVAGLQAYLIMRARDLIMKTWERYKRERVEQGIEIGVGIGVEKGREEGREDLARELLDIMDKQPPDERNAAVYDFLSKIRKNGNGKSE